MTKETINNVENVIAHNCFAARLRMLNRVVTNVYDEALRPIGLKTSQLNILVAAAKLGLARPTEICDRLQLDPSTLSRNVERMKIKGWLEVIGDEDGRAQPFQLTPKGRRLLEKAKPAWDQAQEKVKNLLGKETVHTIADAVGKIRGRV